MTRSRPESLPSGHRRLVELLRPWHPAASVDTDQYAAIGPRPAPSPGTELGDTEAVVTISVVSRRHRLGLHRRLRRAGLQPQADVLLVPRWPDAEHLLTIGTSLPDAADRHLGGRRSLIRLLMARAWGRRILSLSAPSVGTIATRGPNPSTPWFAPQIAQPVELHVSGRPRSDAPTQLTLVYAEDPTSPAMVMKSAVDTAGVDRLQRERRSLAEIGSGARPSGVAVPQVVGAGPDHFTMSTVGGRPLDSALREQHEGFQRIAMPVLAILERWQHETRASAQLFEIPAVSLVDQLATVSAAHPELVPYASAVEDLIELTSIDPVVTVARHGDLTAANVVRSDLDGALGFLDWESATNCSLPTTDDWYFAADSLAVSRSCSHADAVEILTIAEDGPARSIVERIHQTQSSLELRADVAALAFHATWIDHAYDDVVRNTSAGRFVAVLSRLSDLRDKGDITMNAKP